MTNTDHYMSRHSKHRSNTDVLNGKHNYEMGKHQYEGLIRSIMPFHDQCYCTLSPVVKYNCVMFLLKYKTTHKYTITTTICVIFFQKCCSLYITANTTECVNYLHRTNNRIYASTVNQNKIEICNIKMHQTLLHTVL